MKDILSIKEAAAYANQKPHVMYWWSKTHPELFNIDKPANPASDYRRISITKENLEEVMRLRQGFGSHRRERGRKATVPTAPQPPPLPASPPPPPPSIAARQGIHKGWWCRKCDAVLPLHNRLCTCLDGAELPAVVGRYKKEWWEPLTANPKVVMGEPAKKTIYPIPGYRR